MKTTHGSTTVEVTIEVEVFWDKITSQEYEFEGLAPITITERIPVTCEVQTRVPECVEQWAKTAAIELFERDYA